MPCTIFLSSSGSKLALWSGPFKFLSKVKCFSTILAPKATAASGQLMPKLWSEKPILWRGNSFCKVCKALKFTSSKGVG